MYTEKKQQHEILYLLRECEIETERVSESPEAVIRDFYPQHVRVFHL